MLKLGNVVKMSWISVVSIAGISLVTAQTYPTRPIRIVTTQPGSGADIVSRLLAPEISGRLGQSVIVDNRGGLKAVETVAQAPPDGYTLTLSGAVLWLTPFMQDKVSWDPMRDFAPIILADGSPNVLVTPPSLPASNVKELIALAKAKPGALNYAGTTGASSHLAGELFKNMAALNIVCILYKGTGPGLNDLIGGQVQMMFAVVASVMPHVKNGRLKALAVASLHPSALTPGLPTVAASLPGYESVSIHGMFAPAKTNAAIINRLNQEISVILAKPDTKEKLLNIGLETIGSTPQQLGNTVKSEMVRLGKVIKDADIRIE